MVSVNSLRPILFASVSSAILPFSAIAQESKQSEESQLPPVDVIQGQPKSAPKAPPKSAAKKKSAPQQVVSPEPLPPSDDFITQEAAAAPVSENPVYGAAGSAGASYRAINGPASPINSTSIVPGNLAGFAGAASRVDINQIDEQHPRETNEIFYRVPGVTIVNDDGMSRHGGIGMRGSPARRSRKVLVMEDGQPINMATFIDPSVHYTPPPERLEAVEVLRGTVIAHGPLNNHGVVNFRNLSPFGTPETVISAAIGSTEGSNRDWNNMRHVHTRQNAGNVGVVASYSGAESGGAWDNEVLRYNDFYGALGWRGIDQDLTISAGYFRQRDNYDEANIEAEEGDPLSADDLFYQINRRRSQFDPGSDFNTYNADIVRLQISHNYYVDPDTTVSSKLYGIYHQRDRYENEGDPRNPIPADPLDPDSEAEGFMEGRLRRYEYAGGETRVEWANRPFLAGMTQDIQAGVGYQFQQFSNKNFKGELGRVLEYGDRVGEGVLLDEDYTSNSVQAFLQSAIHVTPTFSVVPGVRFVYYDVERTTFTNADADASVVFPVNERFDHTRVLPGVGFNWKAAYLTNVYGGYHQGLAPHVARGEAFPLPAEIGNNYQVGVRSTAFTGLTFDVAYFHSDIKDFQIKEAFTDDLGNNVFGSIDKARINGVELYARLDSNPFVRGPWNFFGEATYTFSDSVIASGVDIDEDDPTDITVVDGNLIPEVPRHYAHMTVGFEHASGFDASVSYTYRGEFYTDVANSEFDFEGESGLVPDVWLLSARASYKLPEELTNGTDVTLFVSGHNLENKLYITDREDGVKPGQGRTIMGGAKVKF